MRQSLFITLLVLFNLSPLLHALPLGNPESATLLREGLLPKCEPSTSKCPKVSPKQDGEMKLFGKALRKQKSKKTEKTAIFKSKKNNPANPAEDNSKQAQNNATVTPTLNVVSSQEAKINNAITTIAVESKTNPMTTETNLPGKKSDTPKLVPTKEKPLLNKKMCNREAENSSAVSYFNCQAGFYGDYVLNRYLKTDVDLTSYFPNTIQNAPLVNPAVNVAYNQKMTQSQMFTNAGLITVNIFQKLNVFGSFGATSAYIKGPSTAFNMSGVLTEPFTAGTTGLSDAINNSVVEFHTRESFSWSVGGHAVIFHHKNLSFGIETQYFKNESIINELNVLSNYAQFYQTNPKGFSKSLIKKNVLPAGNPTTKASVNYTEWQVGAGFSLNIKSLVPYIGLKWSEAHCRMGELVIPQLTGTTTNPFVAIYQPGGGPTNPGLQDFRGVCVQLNDLQLQSHLGLVLGATLVDSNRMYLSIESRILDEVAFHLTGQLRF